MVKKVVALLLAATVGASMLIGCSKSRITSYNVCYTKLLRRINRQIVDKFNYRCPICGFPLKYEFNKNYGLSLYICTNDPEICDFMTNDKSSGADIFKCPECDDGYMIVIV